LTAILIYAAIPGTGLLKSLLYLAIHISFFGALAAGMRAHRPTHRKGWYLFGAGHLLYLVGDVFWYPIQVGFGVVQPYPGPADYFFVAGYLVILWGLWELIRARGGGRDRAGRLDSGIVTLGLSAVSLVFLIGPSFGLSGLSLTARIITASFPLIDVLFLAVLARLAFVPGARLPAYKFLFAAIVSELVVDSYYSASSLAGTFSFASPFLVGYLLFFVLGGAAVLHPSMRTLAEPEPNPEGKLTPARLAFLAASALVPPLTVLLLELRGEPGNGAREDFVPFLAVLSGAMFLLVIYRMHGLVVDITHHKKMERLKNEFTSVVSHELRTPLTSIRGALGLLAGGAVGPLPDKAQRMLTIASSNAERLVRLIDDILDIDRMESGNLKLEHRPCNVAELLSRAGDEMGAMAQDAGINLSVGLPNLALEADPDRVMQVLTNLLSNALKFSPPESTVSLGARAKGNDVLFFVKDEGRGISADKTETIFSRFQQVDSSDSREKGGTGLGLAICRNIVAHHGGRIWVESAPDQGSLFCFTLPERIEYESCPPPMEARGATVLVCDDDPAILEVTTTLLEKRGYNTVAAKSGEEALERAGSTKLAAVILDLILPGMTGWETATAFKARPDTKDVPIIIQSIASPRPGRAPVVDVLEWLGKPIDEASLFGALDKATSNNNSSIKTVLVVEDDLDLAQVLTTTFEGSGLEVFHAPTSSQAIRLTEKLVPDLIVLDLTLQGGNGLEVVDWLNRNDRFRGIPVVVYTAEDLDEQDLEQLKANGSEVLVKGRVTPEQLEKRVLKLLNQTREEGRRGPDYAEMHSAH
ncbi:MAG: response regulator, partial [Actinomycetota bacterium]|nr:response regulator [Actinomycetota bacterium]